MRSIDRLRQRYQKSEQFGNKQQIEIKKTKPKLDEKQPEIWDFKTSPTKPNPPKLPMFLSEVGKEDKKQSFERFIRQLSRSIYACSLCERGTSLYQHGNNIRDPHYPPSIWHREIAIIKWEPDNSDFSKLVDIDNRDDFYITSVIKCQGDADCPSCPFFDLELRALDECWFKMIIVLDEKTSDHFGMEWKPGKLQTMSGHYHNNAKMYCCEYDSEEFKTIIKGLSNPQIRKRLLTS